MGGGAHKFIQMGYDMGMVADSGFTFQVPVQWAIHGWKKFVRALTMRPVFLSPQQGAGSGDAISSSWWHIPVTVTRDTPWWPKRPLLDCEVRCWVKDISDNEVAGPIYLRWRKRGETPGTPYMDLWPGKIESVPVALRLEHGPGLKCLISSSRDDEKAKFLDPGVYKIIIQVEDRRGKKWIPDELYRLTVPENDASNGLFNLEIIYKKQIQNADS